MKKPKLLKREAPDWQKKKLELATTMISQNQIIIDLLIEIRNEMKNCHSRYKINELKEAV